MAEQLPIVYTFDDLPEQCRACPRVLELIDENDSLQPQGVSDTVRELNHCKTGPLEQNEYKPTQTTRQYHPQIDDITGYNPNVRIFSEDAQMFVDGAIRTIKVPMITERELKPTGNSELVCGLDADPYRLRTAPNDKLRDRIYKQIQKLQKYKRNVKSATDPKDFMDPKDFLLAALTLQHETNDPTARPRRLERLNNMRKSLGLDKYVESSGND